MIKAITNCNGRNQCHHCETPKCSQDEHLKCNEGGHGDKQRLEATRQPCQRTRQERCEIVVRSLCDCHEYHNDTHPATTIILTGLSITAMQARRTQKDGTICKKRQADWENSCPRSPAMTVGSTSNIQKRTCKQNKKNKAVVTRTPRVMCDNCWTSCNPNCLAEPLKTIPKDNRISASNDNKNHQFLNT
jgi:hypothetical protein